MLKLNFKSCYSIGSSLCNRGGYLAINSSRNYQTKNHKEDDLVTKAEPDYKTESKYDKYLAEKFKGDDLGHISPNEKRPLKNKPFLKQIFCGEYQLDYLKFPENPFSKDHADFETSYLKPLRTYLENEKYENVIDQESGNFTEQSLTRFKELNLVKQLFPKEFGGLQLDFMKQTRLMEETGVYPSLGMQLIYNNNLGAQFICKHGNDKLKAKYMSRIVNGDLKVVFCFTEDNTGIDVNKFETFVRESFQSSNKKYILNGKKSWTSILTTDSSNTLENDRNLLFVVIAKSNYSNTEKFEQLADKTGHDNANEHYDTMKEKNPETLNAFVIDRQEVLSQDQILIRKKLNNYNGLNLYDIEFKNIEISSENLLGNDGDGFDLSIDLIEKSRYLVGALCVGLLKNIYKSVIDYTINTKQFKRSIYNYPIIKLRLCNIEKRLYAMESMCYMTAGIQDSYEMPDIGLESAATKIFCTENLIESVNDCMEIMAMSAYSKLDDMKHRYLNDVNYLLTMLNTNDVLRNYISVQGLSISGVTFHDEIKKLRSPLEYPGYMFRQLVKNFRITKSVDKKAPTYFYLWEHVHPSLSISATNLEQMAVKFMMAIKSSFIISGRDLVEDQLNLKRLADIAVQIYAVNSMIARASRSYATGLKNSKHELAITDLYSYEISRKVKLLFEDIIQTKTGENLDNLKLNIAEEAIKLGSHAASHSTARNY